MQRFTMSIIVVVTYKLIINCTGGILFGQYIATYFSFSHIGITYNFSI